MTGPPGGATRAASRLQRGSRSFTGNGFSVRLPRGNTTCFDHPAFNPCPCSATMSNETDTRLPPELLLHQRGDRIPPNLLHRSDLQRDAGPPLGRNDQLISPGFAQHAHGRTLICGEPLDALCVLRGG